MEAPSWQLIRILSAKNVEEGFEIKLAESRSYLCGRGKNKDVACDSKLVSKNHCIFFRDANKIYVQDLQSTNGTFINAKKLIPLEVFELRENDVISLGVDLLTTDNKEIFIYRLKREVISIDLEPESENDRQLEVCHSVVSKDENANLGDRNLDTSERTAESNQGHGSDDEIEILSNVTNTVVEDRTVMKLKMEFNIFGNILPRVYLNPTADLTEFSNIIEIVNQPHLTFEDQRERISEEIEIVENVIETAEKTQIGQESNKLPEINIQNEDQNFRKAGDEKKYSRNIQNYQEIPSVSATVSKEFLPKYKKAVIFEVVSKVAQTGDPKKNPVIQNKELSAKKCRVKTTLENEETNKELSNVDKESKKIKDNCCQKAAENKEQSSEHNRTLMSKFAEYEKQDRDELVKNKDKNWDNVSNGIAANEEENTMSLISKPHQCKDQNKQVVEGNEKRSWKRISIPSVDNWEENNKSMSKCTEYKNQNRRRFEKNEQRSSKISDTWKSSFTPASYENPFTIGSSREGNSTHISEFVNDMHKNQRDEVQSSWGRSFSPPSNENPFSNRYSREENNSPPVSKFAHDSYINKRRNMNSKWKKSPASAFEENPFNTFNRKEKVTDRYRNQREEGKSKWKNSLELVSEENPDLFTQKRIWNKSLLSVVLQKESTTQNVLESKEQEHRFVQNRERDRSYDSIASSKEDQGRSKPVSKYKQHEKKNRRPFLEKEKLNRKESAFDMEDNRNSVLKGVQNKTYEFKYEVPSKEKTIPVPVESTQKDSILNEIDRKGSVSDKEKNRNSVSKGVQDKAYKSKVEIPSREKAILFPSENTRKDPILNEIEKNTKNFKKIITEKLVENRKKREEVVETVINQEQVASSFSSEDNSSEERKFLLRASKLPRDNDAVAQILKTLNAISYSMEDINKDKESSDDGFSFLSKGESSLTSISDSTSVSSLGINIKRKKTTKKLNECKKPEEPALSEEPPLKKPRIEEERRKLVDYDTSSTECEMEDIEVNRVVKLLVQKTHFNLKEPILKTRSDLITNTVKQVTVVATQKSYDSDFKSDEVLMDILSWDPAEFLAAVEYSNCKACSENYNKLLHYTSRTYEDYETYCRTFISFLLMEVANGIKSEFLSIEKSPFFADCVIVKDSATEFLLTERNSFLLGFQIKIECSERNVIQFPKIGDLLSIEIIGENYISCSIIFAYVSEVSVSIEGDATQIMEDEDVQLCAACTVVTKLLEFDIYKSRIKSLRVIVGALHALSLVDALEKFKTSPLLPLILHPNPKTYSLFKSSDKSDVLKSFRYQELQKNLDYEQLTAVLKVMKIIQSEEPKISLIEGPPGTGKTNIATNIILRLLAIQEDLKKQDQSMRILVCAGSKSEIDEILFRLSTEKKRLGMDCKLVRVGNPDMVQERIKDFALRQLAVSYADFKQEDIEMNPLEYARVLDSLEKIILTNANVIFCTLRMCLSELMSSVFGEENPISVCIVDEAAQVSEIEILKPLSFGTKKLVLLGDGHKTSKNISLFEKFNKTTYIEENGKFHTSLFSRLLSNFDEIKSTVINLEAQYRMNKRVTFLINKYFYNEILENKESKQEEFPVYSCSIFSLHSLEIRKDEATFAANLIFCILNYTYIGDLEDFGKPISIGVIVPYSSSKKRLEAEIEQWMSNISMNKRNQFTVDVNTIGGFKNQERDILIISCIKKNPYLILPSGELWLYTSMTKVKYSLIMYGVHSTFEKTKKVCMWNSFIEYLKRKKNLLKIRNPSDPMELHKKLLRKKYQSIIDW